MNNLLTVEFWFNLNPGALIPLMQNLFISFIAILAVAAFLIAVIKRKKSAYKGFFNRLYGFCLSNALIGLVLLFFNYEVVPFFSARFWLGLYAIEMLVWFIFIFKKLKEIPRKQKQIKAEKELKKYLP